MKRMLLIFAVGLPLLFPGAGIRGEEGQGNPGALGPTREKIEDNRRQRERLLEEIGRMQHGEARTARAAPSSFQGVSLLGVVQEGAVVGAGLGIDGDTANPAWQAYLKEQKANQQTRNFYQVQIDKLRQQIRASNDPEKRTRLQNDLKALEAQASQASQAMSSTAREQLHNEQYKRWADWRSQQPSP